MNSFFPTTWLESLVEFTLAYFSQRVLKKLESYNDNLLQYYVDLNCMYYDWFLNDNWFIRLRYKILTLVGRGAEV